MNQNDISTYALNFNYGTTRNENVQEILKSHDCGNVQEVLSDSDTKLPQHFMDCLTIFALDELNNLSIFHPSSISSPFLFICFLFLFFCFTDIPLAEQYLTQQIYNTRGLQQLYLPPSETTCTLLG